VVVLDEEMPVLGRVSPRRLADVNLHDLGVLLAGPVHLLGFHAHRD
jgi:hypothetical protein